METAVEIERSMKRLRAVDNGGDPVEIYKTQKQPLMRLGKWGRFEQVAMANANILVDRDILSDAYRRNAETSERQQYVRNNAVALLNQRDAKIERQRAELCKLNRRCESLKEENERLRGLLGSHVGVYAEPTF